MGRRRSIPAAWPTHPDLRTPASTRSGLNPDLVDRCSRCAARGDLCLGEGAPADVAACIGAMGRPDRPPPFRRVTSSRKSLPFNHGAGHSADGHGGARGVGILGCHEGTLGPKASTRSKRRKPLVRVGVWLGVVLLTDSDSASVCNRSIASLPVALDTKREAAGRAGDFVRRQRSGFKRFSRTHHPATPGRPQRTPPAEDGQVWSNI